MNIKSRGHAPDLAPPNQPFNTRAGLARWTLSVGTPATITTTTAYNATKAKKTGSTAIFGEANFDSVPVAERFTVAGRIREQLKETTA